MTENKKKVYTPLMVGDGDLKIALNKEYQKIVNNAMGDEAVARKFLSNALVETQKNPKLLQCDTFSLVNSFMIMSDLGLMPSSVMGEAYVIPYKIKGKMTANFQLGYQGVIKLISNAGITELRAEMLREKDKPLNTKNGFDYSIDPSLSEKERGKIVGVYASAKFNGGVYEKYMNIQDIIAHGKKYSKTFAGGYDSTWKTDPEWMYKKTVILQLAKLLPKTDKIRYALEKEYEWDSKIKEKIDKQNKLLNKAKENMSMGNLLKDNTIKNDKETKDKKTTEKTTESSEVKQ